MLTTASLSGLVPSNITSGATPEQPAEPRSHVQGPAADRETDAVERGGEETLIQMLCRLAADRAK